ncbi:sulfotransferase domain-containing protein [Celeribacter halophilus]|uniref:Sulfotransferase domain-containing protein n=1 Tax=Celeribacter halophilus TaxID=576117 RepID=A0AAW7Y0S8_9RHOB|nr:sulfotransferase domain-containing protein [Celeribacter halophilus]MDO6458430.1 sulfotransferase domain-containing protein [Celeribacter halophilus]
MKIDAFIIGSQKSGTTSLLRSLAKHPDVSTHQQPEMTYFSEDWEFGQGEGYASKKYFPDISEEAFTLAKYAHGMYISTTVDRALESNPEMKFIIVLREPVARAVSAFNYARQLGAEGSTDINHAMFSNESLVGEDPNRSYIRLGEYDAYLEQLFTKLNRNQLNVVFLEDLKTNWMKSSAELQQFLGLKHVELGLISENAGATARSVRFARMWYAFNRNNMLKKLIRPLIPVKFRHALRKTVDQLNTTTSKERIAASEDLITKLKEHYASHNERLKQILERPLPPTWSDFPQDSAEKDSKL